MESLLHDSKKTLVTINGIMKDHNSSSENNNVVINLDHGDPKMFYSYWKKVDNECSVTIKASDLISYFVNPKEADFFYQMPGFNDAIRRVHRVIGNAVAEDRYIIGGTGSSQLFITALRALALSIKETNSNGGKRIPVVCAEPYYSYYGEAIEQERSKLFEWQGDANTFQEKSGPYVEVVTSPNNPDGTIRTPVVNREEGVVIYDLAYYWPHYTPITSPADYDVMLFTMSKTSGHAGSRVGIIQE
uniref:Alliinase C-terminal domain-containing protein n=1 Tax=Chenopodium quinoa TaxID=63459 RepID=A0A803LRB6_CHEQI